MNLFDRAIAFVSPVSGLKRAAARYYLNGYEAAKKTRLHNARQEHRSGDHAVQGAARSIRGQARFMEENEDLIDGLLTVMVNHVVGAEGIGVEPQPLTRDGEVHEEFSKQLLALFSEWSLKPETTGEMTRPEAERLACRTWLRDGEMLGEMIFGSASGLHHPNGVVPFSVNLLEPDFLNLQLNDPGQNIVQGIQRNEWQQPKFYHLFKRHPGSSVLGAVNNEYRRVDAWRMLHPKLVKRLHQGRGISVLASALKRVGGINNYEESELVAARLAAAMAFYIKKGDPQSYGENDNPGEDPGRNYLSVKPGTVYDDLKPGEEMGTLESNRPNGFLQSFLDGMVRRVCSAVGVNYSTVAKKYDGTYSAQRQELVESFVAYGVFQNAWIAQFTRPTYRNFVRIAMMTKKIHVPPEVDPSTIYNAWYQAPVMPWIDPAKESEAHTGLVAGGFSTEAHVNRSRGLNPGEVKRQRAKEVAENKRLGLVFSSDAQHKFYGNKNEEKSTAAGTAGNGDGTAE